MNAMPVVQLSGSAYDRGFTHGSTLKNQINKNIMEWNNYVYNRHQTDALEYRREILKRTQYLSSARLHCPELCEEIRGLADGSGNDFDTMFALQLIPEVWAEEPANMCTVVVIRYDNGTTVLSQNMDIDEFYDGTQVILHIKDDARGLEACIFTAAGLLGLCGTNSAKLSLCCNTVSQLQASESGVPAAFIARTILTCDSFLSAKKFFDNRSPFFWNGLHHRNLYFHVLF